ncbi:MAG TPA: hypothetical protein VGW35_16015 [Methylomirabilota bacterium]|nr:hypothetical protein [Methylomirabilota bacterium]
MVEDGRIASERIHWDQAWVLAQVGLLDPSRLPIAGSRDGPEGGGPELPSNELMKRTLPDERL